MAGPILGDGEDMLLLPGLGVDQPVRVEAGGGQPRREQVARLEHPQDRALSAGENGCGEHRGGRAVGEVGACADDLVQRAA